MTRRRLAAAASAALLLAALTIPPATADPDPAAGAANPDCGSQSDVDPPGQNRLYLWNEVRGVTPMSPGHNRKVVFPVVGVDNGYAIKGAGNDQLLVPTLRIRGIECPTIWQPSTLNYWQYAWNEGAATIKPSELAIGVNSAGSRDQDQLHVHLSKLDNKVRDALNSQLDHIADNPSLWNRSIVQLAGHSYRALHVPDLGNNLFALAKNSIAPTDMRDQAMLVTQHSKGGYIVLDSQAVPAQVLPGGVGYIDALLYKK